MHQKTVRKLDYLGNYICVGKKKDGSCPMYDVNSDKGCPKDWVGETDWHTQEKWDCEERYEEETITVKSGQPGKKKDGSCPMYDVNSDKECPKDWVGETDWHTQEKWDCEERYEEETITVKSG